MEFHRVFLILVTVLFSLSWDVVSSEKTSCPNINFPNGRARVRGKGKLVNFKCKRDFALVGVKFAVCLDTGKWSQQIPICVGTTCTKPDQVPNLIVQELYQGGVLKFICGAGLTRSGPEKVTCDGDNWSEEPPKCIEGAALECTFENQGLCGWSHDFDDDFDWTWHKGDTPTADTGPSFDHTTNSSEGHYLYMESSAPQSPGQKTRILSPAYAPENLTDMCLEFFYHMNGPDGPGEVGDLDVYVKPLSVTTHMLNQANNIFHQSGNQGKLWQRGYVKVPQVTESIQIVFQATRLKSWSGDIAIDDVKLEKCVEEATTSDYSTENEAVKEPEDNVDESHSESTVEKATTNERVITVQVTDSPTTLLTKLPTEKTSLPTSPMVTSPTTTKTTAAATTSTTASTTTTTMPRTTTTVIITTPRTTTPSTTTSSTTTTPSATTTTSTTTTTTTKRPTTISTTPAFISTSPTVSTTMSTSTTTTHGITSAIKTTTTATTEYPTTPTITTTTTSTTGTTPTTTMATPPRTPADSTISETEITDAAAAASDSDVYVDQWSTSNNDATTTLAITQTDPGNNDGTDTDNNNSDNYDYDGYNRNENDGNNDHDNNDDGNKENSEEDNRHTVSPGSVDHTSSDASSTASTFNQSSNRNDSLLFEPNNDATNEDRDSITFSSRHETEKVLDTNDLSHGAIKKSDSDSSSNTKEMVPLIVGVAAAVLIAALVIGVLAYMWARKQKQKQEKEQEDQMNIITEYAETNLSV